MAAIIHKVPLSNTESGFLSNAAKWAKKRIQLSTPAYQSQSSETLEEPEIVDDQDAKNVVLSVNLSENGDVVIVYPGQIDIWRFRSDVEGGSLCCWKTLPIKGINGTILDAWVIYQDDKVRGALVQTELKNMIHICTLIQGVAKDLVSGSQHMFVHAPVWSEYIAIITKKGEVSLYLKSGMKPAKSGLVCHMGPDGKPLISLSDIWCALVVKRDTLIPETPIILPPKGPLHERLRESFSVGAVSSWRSISSAGRYYLSGRDRSSDEKTKGIDDKPLNDSEEENETLLLTVQVIDISSGEMIGNIAPTHGVSNISLCKYDTVLAVASKTGDTILTYDLTFLPVKTALIDKYSRGKVPTAVSQIMWDAKGGLGLITSNYGSFHWFDKLRSLDSSLRVWKLSHLGIVQAALLPAFKHGRAGDDGSDYFDLIFRIGYRLILASSIDGCCKWEVPVPIEVSKTVDTSAASITTTKTTTSPTATTHYQTGKTDPLSFYEMDSSAPNPYVYTDMSISFGYTEKQNEQTQNPIIIGELLRYHLFDDLKKDQDRVMAEGITRDETQGDTNSLQNDISSP